MVQRLCRKRLSDSTKQSQQQAKRQQRRETIRAWANKIGMVSAAAAFYIGYQYYNHDWEKESEFPLNTHISGMGSTVFNPFLVTSLSLFTRSLIESKNAKGERFLNAVIFIDEVDKTLKSTDKYSSAGKIKEILLEMLEPSRSEYTLKDLGTSLDVSRFIFILAANIMSRCKTVRFPPFEAGDRTSIAYANFDRKIQTKASKYGFSVTGEERTFVEKLVQADIAQGNAGVRTLLSVLDEYVNFLTQKSVFPSEGEEAFNIEKSFDEYGATDLQEDSDSVRDRKEFAAILMGAQVEAQRKLQQKDEEGKAEAASTAQSEEPNTTEKKKKKRGFFF